MELGILHSVIGEIWKPIIGFPNYAVSNHGRVYSFTREEVCNGAIRMRYGRILIPRLGNQGYYYVGLCRNNKVITKKVHRLVAENFLPNPSNLECVNHKDECRTNNTVENLEWCTYSYNSNYGSITKRRISTLRSTGYHKKICQYDLQGNFITVYNSILEAERLFSENGYNICNCCKGRAKTAYGFKWRYKVC